ncbi:Protein LSM14 A [Phytophthora boehmeriae]|uniref:Protein LSM14 A n=1 Tax=Phytophthora boehmeriae TaxID=109152 RepID=A0A8T1WZX1_9STRA|nr:Protein LSM14 A [Phytophthora boehmeriae]
MQQPPLPPTPPDASTEKPRDGIPYLGSRISLVSKTDIRYEGFLFNIDTRQSTVALQSVRSFGTEGRRPEHVPPSPHVLQYATFKASEIKDLHVCEAAPPQAPQSYAAPPPAPVQAPAAPVQAPVQPPLPSGPPPPPTAPVAPSPPVSSGNSGSKPTLLTPGSVSSAQKHETAPVQQVQTQQVHSQQRRQGQQSNAARTIPGMGGHLLKRKERRVPTGVEGAGAGPDDASGEFNFAEGLNDFDKQQEFSKLEENTKKESKGSYQKSSFFDTISCDALDRLEGQRSRMSGAEERKLNTETFGAVGLNNRRNFRGGRGRGGRRSGGYRSNNWNGGRGNESWNGGRGNGGRGRNNDN